MLGFVFWKYASIISYIQNVSLKLTAYEVKFLRKRSTYSQSDAS